MEEKQSLKGKLLVAMPSMGDARFHHAVILICSHDKNGAMGLVLNNPLTGLSFDHMIEHLNIQPSDLDGLKKIEVLGGGPVEAARGFVVHKTDYFSKDTIEITDELSITGTLDVLKEIINGGGPDPRDPTWAPRGRTSASRPFGRPPNKMKSSVSAAMIFTNRTLSQSTHTRYSVKKSKSLPRVA